MERGAGILGDKAEEFLPPRVIYTRKEFFAERLQLLGADCANGSGNGSPPGFRDFLHVYSVEWHNVGLFGVFF